MWTRKTIKTDFVQISTGGAGFAGGKAKGHLHVVDKEVKGLVKRVVNTEEEALALFFAGESIRSKSKHALNSSSSRSHCIFTLYVVCPFYSLPPSHSHIRSKK